MNDIQEIQQVNLQEPLTELTATMSVDLFDGNLFLMPTGWNGERTFRVAIAAGRPPDPTLPPFEGVLLRQ